MDAIIHVKAIIQDLRHGENLEFRSFCKNVAYFLNENCKLYIYFFLSLQTTPRIVLPRNTDR
jgi:hypothetical protein